MARMWRIAVAVVALAAIAACTDGPAPGAAATSPAGPRASTTGVATSLPPAGPPRSGYVLADQPTAAAYAVGGDRWFNSAGGQVRVQRRAAGAYTVSFAGLSLPDGVAHVTAYGPTPHFCVVQRVRPGVPTDEVYVLCFDPQGRPADTMFLLNRLAGGETRGAMAYLLVEGVRVGTVRGRDVPPVRFDSTGADPSVTDQDDGTFLVTLPAAAQPGVPDMIQVTAYGDQPVRCRALERVGVTGPGELVVGCFDPAGSLVRAHVAVSYTGNVDVVGRFGQADRIYPTTSLFHTGVGVYRVLDRVLWPTAGHVIAHAAPPPGPAGRDAACHVAQWSMVGASLSAEVRCFTSDGSPADTEVVVAATA